MADTTRRQRVLVTGAAGFIGAHLSERLIQDGFEVLGVDRLSDYYDPAVKRASIRRLGGADACWSSSATDAFCPRVIVTDETEPV